MPDDLMYRYVLSARCRTPWGEHREDLPPDISGARRLSLRGAISRFDRCRRSGKQAFELRALSGTAVRGQYELDRQVEQRTEPSSDILTGHVFATAESNV